MSLLIRCRYSRREVCRDFIEFERRIHVEIMTLICRGNFDADSTFKIDKISMNKNINKNNLYLQNNTNESF